MTVFDNTGAGGFISSVSTVYSTARSGSNLVANNQDSANSATVGQRESGSNFIIWEGFIAFDTSSIPDGHVISAAQLSILISQAENIDTNFTLNVYYTSAWSSPFDTDTNAWVAGASLSGLTLAGTLAINTGSNGTGVVTFSNLTGISKTSVTYLLLASNRQVSNQAPGNELDEFAQFGGDTNDAQLDVTHAAVSSENAAINVTDSPAVTAGTDKASSENAAINVTESAAVFETADKASSENAAFNVTETTDVTVDIPSGGENAAFNVTESDAVDAAVATSENAGINVTESDSTVQVEDKASSENAGINVTEADTFVPFGDFPPRRLRAEIYTAAGASVGTGPIYNVLAGRYRYALDEIGAYDVRIPATDEHSLAVQSGRIIHLHREGEGLVFRGIIDKIATVVDADGRPFLQVSGSSISRQLVHRHTGLGRAFQGANLSTIASTLLSGSGWTTRTLGTPTNDAFTIRYDAKALWASLDAVAVASNFHMREYPWDKQIDIAALGTDSGIVFQDVAQITPELEENQTLFPVVGIKVMEESDQIWNSIIALGAGEGINKVDLKQSDRVSPYTKQNTVGPDGTLTYYLEDAASVAAYGIRQKVISFKDLQPLSLSTNGFKDASNVLYDMASTWLSRHKDPLITYEVDVMGPRHIEDANGQPLFLVGDKIRLVYKGWAQTEDGTMTYLNVNQLLWVMEMARNFAADGSDRWQFTLATVDRFQEDDAAKMVDAINDIMAIKVAPRPFTYREVHGPFRNSTDSGFPIDLKVNFDANVFLVHQSKLSFTIRGLRANFTGAASGGGQTSSSGSSHSHSFSAGSTTAGSSHSHTLNADTAQPYAGQSYPVLLSFMSGADVNDGQVLSQGPSPSSTQDVSQGHTHVETGGTTNNQNQGHTHSLNSHTHLSGVPGAGSADLSWAGHTHDIDATTSGAESSHTHDFSGSTSGNESSHTHTVSAHTHTVNFGITQQSTPGSMGVTVSINGVDRTSALGGPWNASQTLDITQYLTDANGQPLRQDNTVQLGSSALGDLEIQVRSIVTATSLIPV